MFSGLVLLLSTSVMMLLGTILVSPSESILTAQASINRKLRKEIMQKYDLQELKNLGRYFKAKAYSKDGQHCYELLIDKQTNNIQVVSQSRVS
jgi:hypothetical protein